MTDRDTLITQFLAGTKWQDWQRSAIAGDASARRYLRLSQASESVVLMDAPPSNGEDTGPFSSLATLLKHNDLSPPSILLHDQSIGFMLLSDLGSTDFAQWVAAYPQDQSKIYKAATDVLIHLEGVTPPANLKHMTPDVGAEMVGITGEYYTTASTADLQEEMQRALTTFAPDPTVLALRDYHAENLIWRENRQGLGRVGLLDFQDAFVAPAGYDLASLLRDARRDVPPELAEEIIAYFVSRTKAKSGFRTQLACLGVQRNLRILGVFARLATAMKKPRYLAFMPRVWANIMLDLKDPALADLKQAVLDTLPPPSSSEGMHK
jgi:aminoglycoside/choline kinase family phosphotransferase